MQSNRVQILSTKVLEPAIIEKAGAHGILITCIPFIESNTAINEALARQINALAAAPINAIFTSSKAVAAVASVLTQQPGWNIFCLFGATRKHVAQLFPQSVIRADAEDSAALAGQLQSQALKEVHFFCGNKRMDTIPQRLAGTQVVLHQHIVYNTEVKPHKIDRAFDGILFFSPSAVESFTELNKIDANTTSYAVGNTTAAALKPHTENIVIAETASGAAMLNKVIETIKDK
ncbi:uroporphyrinogen-III synthase [Niabella insulamsoli]|uniref:uroporphyrinogen-III synthase n=1 Tax=Niabella insulamsoli TaxID=3144874 RepID=UPI0031FD20FA